MHWSVGASETTKDQLIKKAKDAGLTVDHLIEESIISATPLSGIPSPIEAENRDDSEKENGDPSVETSSISYCVVPDDLNKFVIISINKDI